jgi:hypothetical protein
MLAPYPQIGVVDPWRSSITPCSGWLNLLCIVLLALSINGGSK